MTSFTPADGTKLEARELGPYVPFDDLASYAPGWASAARRIDPYYSQLWTASGTVWTDRRTLSGYRADGQAMTTRMRRMCDDVDPSWLFSENRNGRIVADSLAGVLMWRMLSADQLGALSGHREWIGRQASRLPKAVDRMVASGMAKIGHIASAPGFDPPLLLAPGRMTSWDQFARHLSFEQWLSITAGQGVKAQTAPSMMRHTLSVTELCLRVAQWCEVSAVTGEHLGRHDALVSGVAGMGHAHRAAADGCIVTPDGRIIALEMTVGVFNVETKVRNWLTTLAHDESRRVRVLFVVAPSPGTERSAVGRLRATLNRELAQSRAASGIDLSDRFAFVEWEDWFPALHTVSARFPTLPARSPARGWDWIDLLSDEYAWSPPSDEWADVATTSALAMQGLRGVPFWLRDEKLGSDVRKRAARVNVSHLGFDSLPVLPYERSDVRPDRSDYFSPASLLD